MDEKTIRQMIEELKQARRKCEYLIEQIDLAIDNSDLGLLKELELWSLAVDAAR